MPSAAAAPAPVARPPGWRYHIAFRPGADALRVRVCFDGFEPERLQAPLDAAAACLKGARAVTEAGKPGDTLTASGRSIAVAGASCIRYEVGLKEATRHQGTLRGVRKLGPDWFLSPDMWLWEPDPQPVTASVTANFDLPKGMSVQVPWPRRPGGGYTLPPSTFLWRTHAAFGHLETKPIPFRGGSLTAVVLGEWRKGKRERALDWLRTSAAAVGTVYGDAPLRAPHVYLMPQFGHSFGYALRGGGPSVALLVDTSGSERPSGRDWTAVHELLHVGHPSFPPEGRWLSEGLATYFGDVARARTGMVTEAHAWWHLLDGFERGAGAGTGRALHEESRKMHATGSYWRVYWAGAAIALSIDVALRRQKASTGLGPAVAALRHEKLEMTMPEALARLDHHTGTKLPSTIAKRHLEQSAFPNMREVLTRLGVRLDGDTVAFDDSAPDAAIRRAITARR